MAWIKVCLMQIGKEEKNIGKIVTLKENGC